MSVDLNWAIGRQIAQRRKVAGYTQRNLADRCGISFQRMSKYESGESSLSAAIFLRIAEALEIPAADLLPQPTHRRKTCDAENDG